MKIFLSYSADDRQIAEEIQLAMVGAGYTVFFDRESLPAGTDYHQRIENAIKNSDFMVFLISETSIKPGSYALTELKFARAKWLHPGSRVLPVRLDRTPWTAMPPYLKSVTVLEPEGNIPAEVVDAVKALLIATPATHFNPVGATGTGQLSDRATDNRGTQHGTQILITVISVAGVIGAAVLANWQNIYKPATSESAVKPASKSSAKNLLDKGLKGPDAAISKSPDLNDQCPEITFWDYSKSPPESSIVRRCEPK